MLSGFPRTQALRDGVPGDGHNGAPAPNPFGAQTAAGQAFLDANTITGRV